MNLKVLFISDISCEPYTSIADRMMVKGLHRKGVEITVITPGITLETIDLEEEGINVIYLPLENKLNFRTIYKLRQIILKGKFDILHFTYTKAATMSLIASTGIKIKKIGYFGSLSIHWYDPTAWFAFLNPGIDRIICPSEAVELHFKKQIPKYRRNRITRIYKGYDPSWFEGIKPVSRKSLGVSPDEFLICSAGKVRKVKGFLYLIKAIKYLPDEMDYKIILVGSGTDSAYIKKLTEKTGKPERFILRGHVPAPPAFVLTSDLYIQPSLSEGLGRAISEAMCLGKPVIVTDGGGAKEYFANGKGGFVIKRGSAKAVANAIKICYEQRNSLLMMGQRAKVSMMNQFNHRHTVEKTYNLYRELIYKQTYPSINPSSAGKITSLITVSAEFENNIH